MCVCVCIELRGDVVRVGAVVRDAIIIYWAPRAARALCGAVHICVCAYSGNRSPCECMCVFVCVRQQYITAEELVCASVCVIAAPQLTLTRRESTGEQQLA